MTAASSFAELVLERAGRDARSILSSRDPEPLAGLDYPAELELKTGVLQQWWRQQRLAGRPEALIAAPQPRGYRTTTKRRVFQRPDGLLFGFASGAAKETVAPSALDSPAHVQVYREIAGILARSGQRPLASQLSWVIVRGEAQALSVVLNVLVFDAPVIRAAKRFGELLRVAAPTVRSLLLYLDPTGSEYYLEAKRPAKTLSLKTIFGSEKLTLAVDGKRLKYPAVSFSQINGAMVSTLITTARELLQPTAGLPLLDLYCGYGLLSFLVGADARQIVGVDHDGPAIEAARDNARYFGPAWRFVGGAIDADFLATGLPRPREPELVILDPPRQGTAPGVVEAISAREPLRVLHICCGIDELPREINAWSRAGWRVERAVPMDLFPGTTGIETLLLLTPAGTAHPRG